MRQKIKIIAEIGVNHNGKISYAKKLIKIASDAGADYVKFQSFKAKNLVRKNTKTVKYQTKNSKESNQFNLLKKLEFSQTIDNIFPLTEPFTAS